MKIDVVLQATGNHAHGVSHGIVNSLKKISLLGTVFEPKAFWGNPFPEDDDGLYEYLACPTSEAILFLGFDWHSQSLHTLLKWKTRIKRSSIIKILYSHETLFNGGRVMKKHHFMPSWGLKLSHKEIVYLVSKIRQFCDCDKPEWSENSN